MPYFRPFRTLSLRHEVEMQKLTVHLDGTQPRWLQTLIGMTLFVGAAIAIHGLVLSVEYSWSRVLDVQTVAGRDALDRAVLVDTPERMRVLRVHDPLIQTHPGMAVCVERRHLISRTWRRYSIVLPGYCRGTPLPVDHPPPAATVTPIP